MLPPGVSGLTVNPDVFGLTPIAIYLMCLVGCMHPGFYPSGVVPLAHTLRGFLIIKKKNTLSQLNWTLNFLFYFHSYNMPLNKIFEFCWEDLSFVCLLLSLPHKDGPSCIIMFVSEPCFLYQLCLKLILYLKIIIMFNLFKFDNDDSYWISKKKTCTLFMCY